MAGTITGLGSVVKGGAGCAGPVQEPYLPAEGEAAYWEPAKTGIVARQADMPAALWPSHRDFAGSQYVGPPDRSFAGREIVALRVSERGFRRLVDFVSAGWATDESGKPIQPDATLSSNRGAHLNDRHPSRPHR